MKFKIVLMLLISSLLFSCNSETNVKNTGSAKLKLEPPYQDVSVSDENKLILVSTNQMSYGKEVLIEKCLFDLVLDDKKDTVYLYTNDTNFITTERYKVGTELKEISKEMKKNIKKMIGWGYYINLNSGWSLGFCEGNSCTDSELTDNSQVKWIFKRN